MLDRLLTPNSVSELDFSFVAEPLLPYSWSYADQTGLEACSNAPASFYLSPGNPMNSGMPSHSTLLPDIWINIHVLRVEISLSCRVRLAYTCIRSWALGGKSIQTKYMFQQKQNKQ